MDEISQITEIITFPFHESEVSITTTTIPIRRIRDNILICRNVSNSICKLIDKENHQNE